MCADPVQGFFVSPLEAYKLKGIRKRSMIPTCSLASAEQPTTSRCRFNADILLKFFKSLLGECVDILQLSNSYSLMIVVSNEEYDYISKGRAML